MKEPAGILNPLDHPICFTTPKRLTPFSAWHEHIPFAMFLVDLLRPNVIVELGTQHGDSYCAFCQAIQELNLDMCCYAIDTWQGDPQAGFYGPEVLADLRAHHDPLYGSFSHLIQSTFDEALQHFADGTIDILHIDGYHTYEAVKHDFESWFPKVSSHGVVLLHDTNVREHDFGVRKLWDEIKLRYPHFEFLHGHGLGILAIGEVRAKEFQALLGATGEDAARIRNFFFQLGHRLTLKVESEAKEYVLKDKVNQLREKEQAAQAQLTEREQTIKQLHSQLTAKEVELQSQRALAEQSLREIEGLRTQVAEKEQAAQAQLTEWEQTIKQLHSQLTAKEVELRSQRALAEQSLREIEGLRTQVAEKEQAVETFSMQVAQRDGRISTLESEVLWQDGRIKTLEAELAYMRNSKSWRITTPLRAIMHVLQRYRNTLPVHALKLFYWLMTGQLGQRLRLRRQARLIVKSSLFDTAFYLEQNPDVAQAGVDPILHYLTFGAKEGRDPSQLFDTSYYLEQNPDVAKVGVNPLVHYLRHGAAEGLRTQDPVGTSGAGRKKQPSASRSTYKRFTLYTSSLGNYFFWEIRDLLASGLEELGFAVDIRNEEDSFAEDTDWHLVIAPHEFFYLGAGEKLRHKEWPDPMILINTEQPSTQWFSLAYDCFSRAYCIWDINYESSQLILTRGFVCEYLPLGYVPGFKLLQEVKELPEHYGTCFLESEIRTRSYLHESLAHRPIDILFVGYLSPRREEFFVKAAPVLSSYLCYLHVSDASAPILPGKNTYMNTATVIGLAQRSKIVLNIHQGQDKYFEWHRIVMHGIWQRALVISEPCGIAPLFRPGLDFVEAPLEEIPEKIKYYLSSPEGQKEAQAIATQGFETLTEKCRLADFLRPLILQLYVPKSQSRFWQSPTSIGSSVDAQDDTADFKRFLFKYLVLSQKTPIKQLKIDLIASIGKADSIRDYGGLWGVYGLYLLEGAKALNCKYAEMIDVTPREEFWEKVRELQAEIDIKVEMKQADFRDPDMYKSLAPVDVSLLYEVMLHQDNPEEVIKNVLSKTVRYVCLAQPVLKEELFSLPNSSVNLQFYPEGLKDMLRTPNWWPKEPVVDRFETRYWMWGQTVSYFKSVFYGYGWEIEHLEVYPISCYWNYALMRFVPRRGDWRGAS